MSDAKREPRYDLLFAYACMAAVARGLSAKNCVCTYDVGPYRVRINGTREIVDGLQPMCGDVRPLSSLDTMVPMVLLVPLGSVSFCGDGTGDVEHIIETLRGELTHETLAELEQ